MNDLNRLSILGRVGGDPETFTFQNGGLRTAFSVATSSKWKDDQGKDQERVQWHRVSLFNKSAEIARDHVKKVCACWSRARSNIGNSRKMA